MLKRPGNRVALKLNFGFFVLTALTTASTVVSVTRPHTALVVVVAIASYSSLGCAYAFVRRVFSQVGALSSAMAEATELVAGGAAQLSSATQAVAQGVVTQSESLTETTGTSELMASITRQSVESSRSAMDLMNHAEQLAGQATQGLEVMSGFIGEISSSAVKISRITKVVDEIAFQTNILALNAAVEAARAGESGAGFAVVADEVRNLAQRSARAAEDIAGLVEESVTRTQEGTAKLEQVSGAMRALIDNTAQMKAFVDEVTMSSDGLASGTEQISKTMKQLEALTQRTAASSEEAAAASQEVSAQAGSMRDLVSDLSALSGEGV